ncbi:prepilin peptidase [Bacillus sp. B15-48]|uniref:A24 family peptidase n=1 Tax=Bacillus sp. B15-48 TaxID=1548601 RepID=UPI00193EC54E|nr:prepilin peptidase [Bacillus sp. B15-48]MBM4764493.1 prepilin peptidase [Bacillus sp. B15-48]
MFIQIILLITVVISLVTDLKNRKILNIVTLPAIMIGFVYYSVTLGWEGFQFSGLGFLLGFFVLLIPYLLGGMGAGDVKLMAAIGALMGASFVFYSFVFTALIGGIISVILIVKKYGFVYSLRSFLINIVFLKGIFTSLKNADKNSSIVFPYGVAITIGTLSAYVWGGF